MSSKSWYHTAFSQPLESGSWSTSPLPETLVITASPTHALTIRIVNPVAPAMGSVTCKGIVMVCVGPFPARKGTWSGTLNSSTAHVDEAPLERALVKVTTCCDAGRPNTDRMWSPNSLHTRLIRTVSSAEILAE